MGLGLCTPLRGGKGVADQGPFWKPDLQQARPRHARPHRPASPASLPAPFPPATRALFPRRAEGCLLEAGSPLTRAVLPSVLAVAGAPTETPCRCRGCTDLLGSVSPLWEKVTSSGPCVSCHSWGRERAQETGPAGLQTGLCGSTPERRA